MNYEKHYALLIESRKNRELDPNEYYERHHIWPRSLGGPNDNWNLVYLTAREHYVAHWLLCKSARDKNEKFKMSRAFLYCCYGTKNQNKKFTSRQYEIAKKNISLSEIPQIIRDKIGKKSKGRKNPPRTEEFKNKMSMLHSGKGNPFYGKKHSEETKKKIGKSSSIALMGHSVSIETRKKISEKRKGKRNHNNSKKYIITFPNGEEKLIKCLNEFCKENNLNTSHMSSCATGKLKQHKGFKCKYYEK